MSNNIYIMNYYSPQLVDHNLITTGFKNLWFLSRSYLNEKKYKLEKDEYMLKNMTDIDIVNNILNDPKQVIHKFDSNNYLTHNKFPYNLPSDSKHYLYWTFSNKTHNDILNDLLTINFINNDVDYMIWTNTNNWRSIITINHYHIIIRKKTSNPINYIKSKQVLQKMIIVARHGPREPILLLPKLKPFNDSGYSDASDINAQLTIHGKKYCNNFGKYIRSIYDTYIDFKQDNTILLSSGLDRTRDSAVEFYNGLFNDISELSVDCLTNKELLGDINISDPVAKLEYITYDNEMKLDVDPDRLNKLNEQIFDVFGYKIQYPKDYFKVSSTIDVYKAHNKELPHNLTDELINNIKDMATEYYYKLFYETKFTNYFCKKLMGLIIKILNNPNINFAYLSTHDVVVYPLAMLLYKEKLKLPDFCSNVRFEMWTNEIRIYYDDNLIYHDFLINN